MSEKKSGNSTVLQRLDHQEHVAKLTFVSVFRNRVEIRRRIDTLFYKCVKSVHKIDISVHKYVKTHRGIDVMFYKYANTRRKNIIYVRKNQHTS